MTTREPLSIEQCVGCATDVAVYSDRQRVDGDVMCSACRRIHRRAERRRRRSEASPVIESAPACPHDRIGISPTGVRYCRDCLARAPAN